MRVWVSVGSPLSHHFSSFLSLDEFSILSLQGFRLPFFRLTHSFDLLSLSTWCFGICSWLCSLFYIFHLSWAWYFILWLSRLILFSTRFSLQKGERQVFTFTPFFLDVRLYHLIIFVYWVCVESESEILCYRWSIDLMTVLFFTPHSFFGSLIEIL